MGSVEVELPQSGTGVLPASLAFVAGEALIAVLFGLMMAIFPWELLLLLVPAWLALIGLRFSGYTWQGSQQRAVILLLAQVPVVGLIVFAAASYRPAKATEIMQDQLSETLPSSTMSLAEIKAFVDEPYRREGFSRLVQFDESELDLQATVTFPDRRVTLRQFLTAIDQQTPFHGRLTGGCANGSTILAGVGPSVVIVSRR